MQGGPGALAALPERALTGDCTGCGGEGSEERGNTKGRLATPLVSYFEPIKFHSQPNSLL